MAQLLFLDTFSHEDTELNLDLVQFPSSVIVEEVRVIPLGGKVHIAGGNIAGGKSMRLGATLPNKFNLEFFVNDLTKPTASTFSSLGKLDYDHHRQICLNTSAKKIRTDGLVLRGHYSAVTLAVYGNFTPTTAEQLALLSSTSTPAPEPEPVVVKQEVHPPPVQGHRPPVVPQKRNDWTNSWPPPVAENSSAPGSDHYGAANVKKEWKMGNGQRSNDEYYDQPPSRHHHSSVTHKQPHNMPRPRSPLRESRSRTRSPPRTGTRSPPRTGTRSPPRTGTRSPPRTGTRSPPRRHQPRRSVTPKSPPLPPPTVPNNGYASPEQNRKRSPSSVSEHKRKPSPSPSEQNKKPPPIEEPAILDDVSDISDGDIPEDDLPMDDEEEEEEDVEPVKESLPPTESTADVASLENQEEDKNGMDDALSIKHERDALVDIPEDMEEISDEEADWSDDGDCFFLDSMVPCDVEFGKDWVDPVALYNVEDYPLTGLQCHALFPSPTLSDKGHQSDCINNLSSESSDVGCEWVENLEAIKTSELTSSENLVSIIRRGLSLKEALKHPVHTFKVRHLKSSLKFTIAVLSLPLEWSQEDISEIMKALMDLILDKTVADPLRVQCLLALHHALNQPSGLNIFTASNWCSEIVKFLASHKSTTRLKVSLTSIVSRISLSESFELMSDLSASLQDRVAVIKQVLSSLKDEDLPILSFLSNDKCGVVPYVLRDLHNMNYLRKLADFCQCVQDNDDNMVEIISTLEEFFEDLVTKPSGLLFLAAFPSEVDQLLALDKSSSTFEFVQLCLHALIKIDQLSFLCKVYDEERIRMETPEMLLTIKDLYGMTFQPVGRRAIVHVLSMSELLKPIIALVKHSGEVDEEQQEKKDMKKSAIRGYACEILLMVIRLSDQVDYLYFFSDELLALGKSDENSKLFELTSWLQWMYEPSGGIEWKIEVNGPPKVDLGSVDFIMNVVKQNMDKISPLSCDLVMAIRFLRQLMHQHKQQQQRHHLRPHAALLSAFSLDFCDHGISILNKVCGYHEQPHLHTATFAGYNGHLLMVVIRLVVRLLKEMFGQRITCLDEGYHDTHAIPTMLKTFTLCTVVSKNSDGYQASLETCSDIVELLITYTSVPVDMSKERTTVWQRMVTDIVKYVTLSPHTYLSGLKLLVEVLPMPLPVQVEGESSSSSDLSNELHKRNMWSAQLYGMELDLKDMITRLLPCKVTQVQKLLIQACHQIGDLSAPTSVIVAEALLQSFQNDPLNSVPNVVNVLNTCAAVKVAFLSLVRDNDGLKNLPTEILPPLAVALFDPQRGLIDDKGEIADVDLLQRTANTLPDRDNSILLMNALMLDDNAELMVKVAAKLSKSLLGITLLRGSWLRHKTETYKKLESLDTPDMDTAIQALLAVSKYLSLAELRDIVNWTEDEKHIFLQDNLSDLASTKEIIEILQGDTTKMGEELDIDWPVSEPLLDQFSQRTTVVTNQDTPNTNLDTNVHTSDSDEKNVPTDLMELIESTLSKDFDIQQQVKQVCDEKSLESERQKKKAAKKSLLESKALANKNLISSFKAGGTVSIRGGRSVFNRGPGGQRPDLFRSRPPNTSRPPSLHVDDFLVLQSRGQQPTGPTGYNKQSLRAAQELFAEKEAKSKGSVVGFREATKEPVFDAASSQPPSNEGGGGPRPRGPPQERSSSGVSKNYRGKGGPSGNGRTFNRDRYGSSSNSGTGGVNTSRGWTPSPSRDNRNSGGRSAYPRRNGKGGGESRRGGSRKIR